jgi:AraC-like DNA-binding protein
MGLPFLILVLPFSRFHYPKVIWLETPDVQSSSASAVSTFLTLSLTSSNKSTHPGELTMPIETLAYEIGKIAQNDGDYPTRIPRLSLYRRSAKTAPLHCIYGLGLGITAQGGKQVTLGEQVIAYGPGQSLLTTVDLPVVAHVTRANLAEPFLSMMLTLDGNILVQLATEMDLPPLSREQAPRMISLSPLDAPLLDALTRLVQLLNEPQLISPVAPLIQREIMARLLSGPHGPYLRQLVAAGSPSHQIAQAMAWLKQNFSRDVLMDELAARVHMSPSTFRQHFRNLAGMSPVQYQRQLRLQEARQLMLNQALDASSTAARVGYESASQFSRDYSRLFGAPPQRDIKRMQHLPEGGVAQSAS